MSRIGVSRTQEQVAEEANLNEGQKIRIPDAKTFMDQQKRSYTDRPPAPF